MKLAIVKFGKPALSPCEELIEEYQKRLRLLCKCDSVIKKEKDEAAFIAAGNFSPTNPLVIFDERGKDFTSKQLAKKMETWSADSRCKQVTFVIGPSYGVSDATRSQAQEVWSLSKLTLQGDYAWALLWEQIYRAFCIMRGTGYHHE